MFYIRLRKLRKEKELTQQELANILQMSRGTYAQYEIGRREPDFETLVKIADFYNVSTDYLLCREDKKIPQNEEETSEDEIFEADLAAHMEGEYGKPPSLELIAIAKKVYKKVLNEILEEGKNKK